MTACNSQPEVFEVFEGKIDNLEWKLSNGILTVSGAGEMTDFQASKTPWFDHMESIGQIVINEGVTGIGSYAFAYMKSLSRVHFAGSVKKIGYAAFESSGLAAVIIPASIEFIDDWAFTKCNLLEIIIFEGPVEEMGNNIFTDWGYVPRGYILEIKCPPFTVRDSFFNDFDREKSYLHVPAGTGELYKSAAGWKEFKNIIEK